MESHHRVDHHILRWRQGQLLGKELHQNLCRGHPPKLIKLIITFHYLITLMQVFLMLRVLQEIDEFHVLYLV